VPRFVHIVSASLDVRGVNTLPALVGAACDGAGRPGDEPGNLKGGSVPERPLQGSRPPSRSCPFPHRYIPYLLRVCHGSALPAAAQRFGVMVDAPQDPSRLSAVGLGPSTTS